jgi:hypothetical protein
MEFAERLKILWIVKKRVVALMRDAVIDDRRNGDDFASEAVFAQGLHRELMLAQSLPSGAPIQMLPRPGCGHGDFLSSVKIDASRALRTRTRESKICNWISAKGRGRCALSKALDIEAPGGSPLALTRSAGQDVIDDFGPYGFIVAGDNDEFGFSIFGHDDADHGNIQKFRWRFELLPFEDGVEWLDCDSGHLFSRLGSSVDGIGTARLVGVAPPSGRSQILRMLCGTPSRLRNH